VRITSMAIIEVLDNYHNIGILTRQKTAGVEFDMVKSFIDYRKNTYKDKPDKKLAIFVEPKIYNSYPDIIFAEYNPFAFENWSKARNILQLIDLKILNYIYVCQKVSSQTIILELKVKYKDLLFSLERLFDARLIERNNQNWVILNKDFVGIKKVEAIEAKVSKWNEVLQQALLNKNFASESWILSKLQGEPKEEIVTKIADFGIGIYLFNNVEFSRASRAKKSKFPTNYNSLVINEWIGKILNS
jgi:hypothetical protein